MLFRSITNGICFYKYSPEVSGLYFAIDFNIKTKYNGCDEIRLLLKVT